LQKLRELLDSSVEQLISKSCFSDVPTISFTPVNDQCEKCGKKLTLYYTDKRKLYTLHIGMFIAHRSVYHCSDCNEIYYPEELKKIVPAHCNIGYDVMVDVGKSMFVHHRTISETLSRLKQFNISISGSAVSDLAKRFIAYLAIAHEQSKEKIKQCMNKKGGYILHIDGTSEGGSPHLISALDEISQFVLANIKTSTEKAEQIIPLLEEVKTNYGNPLATVSDMGKAMISSIETVFPETLHFICHFHFLRDIGKDLLDKQYSIIRNTLKKYGISKQLRYRLRHSFNTDERPINIESVNNMIKHKGLGNDMNLELVKAVCYTLITWALDGKNHGDGLGFPFDRPHYEFFNRLVRIYDILKKTTQSYPDKNTKVSKLLNKLTDDLQELVDDAQCKESTQMLNEKIHVFDDLRAAMRIALPCSPNGLNDPGKDVEIKLIKQAVEKFKDSLIQQDTYDHDKGYRKMVEQIEKYWNKLFADPIEVKTENESIKIQPQRTNNILEQFFRDFRRNHRRKTGNNSISKKLQAMLAETPLVKNLENKDYLEILLGGKNNLQDRFAEIDQQLVHEELKKAQNNEDKISSQLKNIIKSPEQMEVLFSLF
jgi:hypothetical protein